MYSPPGIRPRVGFGRSHRPRDKTRLGENAGQDYTGSENHANVGIQGAYWDVGPSILQRHSFNKLIFKVILS